MMNEKFTDPALVLAYMDANVIFYNYVIPSNLPQQIICASFGNNSRNRKPNNKIYLNYATKSREYWFEEYILCKYNLLIGDTNAISYLKRRANENSERLQQQKKEDDDKRKDKERHETIKKYVPLGIAILAIIALGSMGGYYLHKHNHKNKHKHATRRDKSEDGADD